MRERTELVTQLAEAKAELKAKSEADDRVLDALHDKAYTYPLPLWLRFRLSRFFRVVFRCLCCMYCGAC